MLTHTGLTGSTLGQRIPGGKLVLEFAIQLNPKCRHFFFWGGGGGGGGGGDRITYNLILLNQQFPLCDSLNVSPFQ